MFRVRGTAATVTDSEAEERCPVYVLLHYPAVCEIKVLRHQVTCVQVKWLTLILHFATEPEEACFAEPERPLTLGRLSEAGLLDIQNHNYRAL